MIAPTQGLARISFTKNTSLSDKLNLTHKIFIKLYHSLACFDNSNSFFFPCVRSLLSCNNFSIQLLTVSAYSTSFRTVCDFRIQIICFFLSFCNRLFSFSLLMTFFFYVFLCFLSFLFCFGQQKTVKRFKIYRFLNYYVY